MITEIDAGHVIYDDLELMGMERRLKGHLIMGGLDREEPMVGENIPDEGMIVIIPKRMSADKTYFNDCTIEVNILLKDIEGEANPQLNELLKKAIETLSDNEVGKAEDVWYSYSIRSHGITIYWNQENLVWRSSYRGEYTSQVGCMVKNRYRG